MASPGAAWTEFGATVGGNVLPAIVNLEYPGENAPLSEKALYYTLSTGLPIAGSLIGTGVVNPKAVIKTGTDVSKNIGTKIIKKGKEILENGIDKARYNMEVFKIKKAYDELLSNPLKGVGTDTIVKIKPRNSEPINLLRGEAIKDEFGNVIAHGRRLKKATGTERNFGLNKIIYKHHIPKEDVIEIPKILRNNTSPKVMESGKIHYIFKNKNGETELMVISPFNSEKNIVTLRKLEE